MKLREGQCIGISKINTPDGEIELECTVEGIKDNIANIWVHNGEWKGLLDLSTMIMEIQVPISLRTKYKPYIKGNDEPDRIPVIEPNPKIHCKFIGFWEYKDGRCTLCGAKEETHDTDHLCRIHKLDFSYLSTECCVCGKIKNDNFDEDYFKDDPFYSSDIPF